MAVRTSVGRGRIALALMEAKTLAHLTKAGNNAAFAREVAVLTPGSTANWVAVIAFHAAVHCFNAFLYERHRIEPQDHQERSRWVSNDPDLQVISPQYDALRDMACKARYEPEYNLSVKAIAAILRRMDTLTSGVLACL